jgi:hypothetical protein
MRQQVIFQTRLMDKVFRTLGAFEVSDVQVNPLKNTKNYESEQADGGAEVNTLCLDSSDDFLKALLQFSKEQICGLD